MCAWLNVRGIPGIIKNADILAILVIILSYAWEIALVKDLCLYDITVGVIIHKYQSISLCCTGARRL